MFSNKLEHLIESLRILPGVGSKTAQRMAFNLLERNREGAIQLAAALESAVTGVHHCEQCRMLSDAALCGICESDSRDVSVICIVESPADVMAIEATGVFRGRYFVLMGHLSPLDGVGPEQLGIDLLFDRLSETAVKELIIATNPTVEGEATAHYLAELAGQADVKASRIAHGVPMGGELEYIDGGTLSHALAGRQPL